MFSITHMAAGKPAALCAAALIARAMSAIIDGKMLLMIISNNTGYAASQQFYGSFVPMEINHRPSVPRQRSQPTTAFSTLTFDQSPSTSMIHKKSSFRRMQRFPRGRAGWAAGRFRRAADSAERRAR
jgi:hypothetical protein